LTPLEQNIRAGIVFIAHCCSFFEVVCTVCSEAAEVKGYGVPLQRLRAFAKIQDFG
jgi:hypothetical protein